MLKRSLAIFIAAIMCLTVATVGTMAATTPEVSIGDVRFYKLTDGQKSEIYVVEDATVVAESNIVSNVDTSASVITAVYNGNRLSSIDYKGDVSLKAGKTPFESAEMNINNAQDAEVKVMVWNPGSLEAFDNASVLNNVSCQKDINSATLTLTGDTPYNYQGLVDNDSRTISFYVPNEVYLGAYSTGTGPYGIGTGCDTAAASANISAVTNDGAVFSGGNGINITNGGTVSVTAPNGTSADYSVVLKKEAIYHGIKFDDGALYDSTETARQGLPWWHGVVGTGAWYWSEFLFNGATAKADSVTTELVTIDDTTGNKGFRLQKPVAADPASISINHYVTPTSLQEVVAKFRIKIDNLNTTWYNEAAVGGIALGECGIVPFITTRNAAENCFTFSSNIYMNRFTEDLTANEPVGASCFTAIPDAGNYELGKWHDFTLVWSAEPAAVLNDTQTYTHHLKIYHNGMLKKDFKVERVQGGLGNGTSFTIATYNADWLGATAADFTLDEIFASYVK